MRRLRARMVRVTGLVCEGHTARPEGEPQPEFAVELSLARATNVCGRKAKLLAHGSQDPIASNTDEAGRAQNPASRSRYATTEADGRARALAPNRLAIVAAAAALMQPAAAPASHPLDPPHPANQGSPPRTKEK